MQAVALLEEQNAKKVAKLEQALERNGVDLPSDGAKHK
jgi:hypothetical protein